MRASPPIEAQIVHAATELERMLQLYPGMVRSGVMPARDANQALDVQTAILNTLRQLKAEQDARCVPLDQALHALVAAAHAVRVAAKPLTTSGDRAL